MYVVEIVAGRNTGITTTAVPLSLHAAPCLAMKYREACWEPGVILLSRGEGKQDTAVAVCYFLLLLVEDGAFVMHHLICLNDFYQISNVLLYTYI